MILNSSRIPPHSVLSLVEVRALAATHRGSALLVGTEESSLEGVLPLVDAKIAALRLGTAKVLAEIGLSIIVPDDFGFAFIQASEGMNSINYRLFKGQFNLYDYQWSLKDSLEDFLATDLSLSYFDGEPLYTGSDYNLSHHAGNVIMYPIDVMCGLLDYVDPSLVVCADPGGCSLEHYVLCHLAGTAGIEYVRMGGAPCAE